MPPVPSSSAVLISEVGPRDGLQSVKATMPTADKLRWIDALYAARVLGLGEAHDWPLAEAEAEWGYEMANYGLGSNSRVRGKNARELLGWVPERTSVVQWIKHDML